MYAFRDNGTDTSVPYDARQRGTSSLFTSKLFTALMNPSINASTLRSCKTILFPQNMRRAGRPLPAAARRVCAPYVVDG